ncbi:hypothetical protein T484DRAFT_3299167 [Baffinella frigidus]|nr:hypothetical protein T484DRAFT_3299167 [Cryptophyta sp. CCMP2293]
MPGVQDRAGEALLGRGEMRTGRVRLAGKERNTIGGCRRAREGAVQESESALAVAQTQLHWRQGRRAARVDDVLLAEQVSRNPRTRLLQYLRERRPGHLHRRAQDSLTSLNRRMRNVPHLSRLHGQLPQAGGRQEPRGGGTGPPLPPHPPRGVQRHRRRRRPRTRQGRGGAMRSNTCLMQLDLGTNQLGDLGAEHMAGLLRSATLLQELRLSDNGIGEIGGVYIAKAYETNTTLMVLDMDMNAIPPTQQARFQDAVRGRGNVGVLRVANHAYGHLVRPKKEEIVVVVVEARKKTPDGRLLTAKSDGESKRGKTPLDMGNVKLKTVEKKEEKKKLSGPLRDLFRRWNGTEGQQKGSKKSRSMDLKEFLEMVKGMGLLAPGKLTRGKAQDVFRAANRAGGGVGGNDGDSAEMDEDEFEFAMIKLAALLRISLEDLCAAGLAEDAKKTGPGKKVNAAGNVAPEPGASLEEVFLHCAAGAGQSKKRAASMDGKEFVVLLEFLRLMPGKVSKTLAMACFTAGKKKSADSSELDWTAFQFAMKKLAKELDVPYESLHLQEPETPGIVARKKSLQ